MANRTEKLKEIQSYYTLNKRFLTPLPELDAKATSNLNTWINKNQQNQKILDILVFNIIPGVLTAGLFHAFYYLIHSIIHFLKSSLLEQKSSFHINWTDHLTRFKNSKDAIEKIESIQVHLDEPSEDLSSSTQSIETESHSEAQHQSTQENNVEAKHRSTQENSVHSITKQKSLQKNTSHPASEETIINQKPLQDSVQDSNLFETLPEDKFPEIFKFLPLQALGNFAQTSHTNHQHVQNYFFKHIDIKNPVTLPKKTEEIEKLLQLAIEKSYTKLFIACILQCDEDLKVRYLHPWLVKATEDNNIDLLKIVLSLKDPRTGLKFFDVNTTPMPVAKHSDTFSILSIAAEKGFVDIMRLCIEKGAKVYRSGRRELSRAICSKNLDCVKIILALISDNHDYDADDMKDYLNSVTMRNGFLIYELNALCEAIDHGTVEIAQLLIDQGADVNQDDDRGCPIKRALDTLNPEMFLLLLRNNYDISKHHNFEKFIFEKLVSHTKGILFMLEDMKKNNMDISELKKQTPEERSERRIKALIEWVRRILATTEHDEHPNIVFLQNNTLGHFIICNAQTTFKS